MEGAVDTTAAAVRFFLSLSPFFLVSVPLFSRLRRVGGPETLPSYFRRAFDRNTLRGHTAGRRVPVVDL